MIREPLLTERFFYALQDNSPGKTFFAGDRHKKNSCITQEFFYGVV